MLHRFITALGQGLLIGPRATVNGSGLCIRAGLSRPHNQSLRPLVLLLARQAARQAIATRCNGEGQ